MRILINAVSARAGGGISYLLHLLEMLPAQAPEMQFLAAIPDIDLPSEFKPLPNLEVRTIPQASGNVFKRYFWENTELIKLCHDWNADLLFCVANVIPLRKPDIPVVVMVQNVAPLTAKVIKMLWRFEPLKKSLQMLLLKALSLYAIRNADQVISLSEATSRLLGKFSPQCKSEILYHGISSNFNPLAPRPEAAGNEPYFLFVSNLYVYKGLEFIVEALACKPELPKVFIAGHAYDRDYVEWVKQKALKAGVAERMIYLDNIPYNELPGWYANATAMVYSSWCENCPNILLEAMACGCPVIAMNTGPMPEICGEAGYFARPFDGKALADAMQNALKNSGSKSEAAKKRAAEFTWQKAMQRHKEIFSKFGQKK